MGLCWLKQNEDGLLVSTSDGRPSLYKMDSRFRLKPVIKFKDFWKAHSVHSNANDTLFAACGTSENVKVLDLKEGKLVRHLRNVHAGAVNVCRFSNTMPNILLSCSLDSTVKLWDLRVPTSMVMSLRSDRPNVTVSFSPDDTRFVVSAIDNNVSEFTLADGGRSVVHLQVPKTGSTFNYTRSYYTASGNSIVCGSSNDDQLFVCESTTGKVSHSTTLYPGKKHSGLYVQSLRGHPTSEYKIGVLISYRYTANPFELLLLDFARDRTGNNLDSPPPFGRALQALADDLMTGSLTGDVCLIGDGTPNEENERKQSIDSDKICTEEVKINATSVRCDTIILRARWSWFRKNEKKIREKFQKEKKNHFDLGDENEGTGDCLMLRINGIDQAGLRSLVSFFCSGSFTLNKNFNNGSLEGLYKLARKRELPELCQMMETWISETQLTVTTATWFSDFAERVEAKGLRSIVDDFMLRSRILFRNSKYAERLRKLSTQIEERVKQSNEATNKRRNIDRRFAKCLRRRGHTLCEIDGRAYVIGGYYPASGGPIDLNMIPILSIYEGKWWLVPSNKINNPENDTFQISHPLLPSSPYCNHKRLALPAVPENLCFHASCSYKKTIYTFGGGTDSFCTSHVWAFDTQTMCWSKLKCTPAERGLTPRPRCRHTATCTEDGRIFILGGRGAQGLVYGDMWEFIISTRKWRCVEAGGDGPSPRFGHTATYFPKTQGIIVFGGAGPFAQVLPMDLYVYSVKEEMWRRVQPAGLKPQPRLHHTATLIPKSNQVILIGGVQPLRRRGRLVLDKIYILRHNHTRFKDEEWSWWHPNIKYKVEATARYLHTTVLLRGQKDTIAVFGGFDKMKTYSLPVVYIVDRKQGDWIQVPMTLAMGHIPPKTLSVTPNTLFSNLLQLYYIEKKSEIRDENLNSNQNCKRLRLDRKTISIPDPVHITTSDDGGIVVASKRLLCWRSEFFRLMFKSRMRENLSQEVILSEIDQQSLSSVLYFLHCGDFKRVYTTNKSNAKNSTVDPANNSRAILPLLRTKEQMNSKRKQIVFRTALNRLRLPLNLRKMDPISVQRRNAREYITKVLGLLVVGDRLNLKSFQRILELELQPLITSHNARDLFQFGLRYNCERVCNSTVDRLAFMTISESKRRPRRRRSNFTDVDVEAKEEDGVNINELVAHRIQQLLY
mmetsp:Transcript_15066/g.22790  ORF Transcript_15066/g.22790 Transcript_15066/m.22790 type:complete len:1178 (+) Transcript_15066:3-3536(+)